MPNRRTRRPRARDRGGATLGMLVDAIDATSPFRLAASWDNAGLIVGDRATPIDRVLLTIDLTESVLDEAAGASTAIIAYHPPIFEPVKRLAADDPRGALLLRAARELAGVISPHTALDAVAGGMSDWLAEGVGAGALAPVEPASALPSGEALLVATKLPRGAVDRVRDAMSFAGAGRIGDYSRCSFEIEGHGTFEGGASTNPRLGQRGRFERAEESRLEMVSSAAALPAVLAALRTAHPYEEPPIEIVPLAPRPSMREGQGRVLQLLEPASTDEIARRVARHLRMPPGALEIVDAAPAERSRSRSASTRRRQRAAGHRMVGLCPGSGGALVARAIELGCTLFVTGEMKHHERLDAAARGCSVILAGHTETERGFLPRYRAMLLRELSRPRGGASKRVPISLARTDRAPARRAK